MKHLDVVNAGSVDHKTLEDLYNSHSLWLYPNSGTETFCITAVKAQGAGCIPVATRASGLNETLAPFAKSCTHPGEWTDLLMKTFQRADSITLKERQSFSTFADKFLWSEIAKKFDQFVRSL